MVNQNLEQAAETKSTNPLECTLQDNNSHNCGYCGASLKGKEHYVGESKTLYCCNPRADVPGSERTGYCFWMVGQD